MANNVIMPQMGESVAEGTITKWLKKVGEHVGRDEPLFEISTDKVDAEIPSPAAGVLSQILVKESQTVPVNTVVAVIDEDGAAVAAPAESRPSGRTTGTRRRSKPLVDTSSTKLLLRVTRKSMMWLRTR